MRVGIDNILILSSKRGRQSQRQKENSVCPFLISIPLILQRTHTHTVEKRKFTTMRRTQCHGIYENDDVNRNEKDENI